MPGRTGPRSVEGKAKVAKNAIKHGLRASKWLSPDEHREFEMLADDLHAEYEPSTATQRMLVERIAMCMSKLRRLHDIENALFHKARLVAIEVRSQFNLPANGLTIEEMQASALPGLKQLDVLNRYQTTLDRQLSKSIGELMVLKAQELSSVAITGATELNVASDKD